MQKNQIGLTVFLVLCWSVELHAESLRCGDRLVNVGDTKYEVLHRCGQPDYREHLPPYGVEKRYSPYEKHHFYVDEEEWFYNFGSNRFVKILTFRNGYLRDIRQGGYGFARSVRENCRVTGGRISKGDSKAEVLMKCGEPDYEDVVREARKLEIDRLGEKHHIYVDLEVWIYNFGPNYFLSLLKFYNGRLIAIEAGDYGH